MKVSFCVDSILSRNHYIETAEIFLKHFKRAPVFTYAYHPEKVLGEIERRPIHSSYLSRMVKNPKKLEKQTYLFPHVARSFHMDCQTQLVMSVSQGFSQGIKRPSRAKHFCYLYDWNFRPRGWLNKVMAKATEQWMRESLQFVDVLWVSREEVAEKVRPFYTGPIHHLGPDREQWGESLKKYLLDL